MTPDLDVGDWIVIGGMGNIFIIKVLILSDLWVNLMEWSHYLKLLFGLNKKNLRFTKSKTSINKSMNKNYDYILNQFLFFLFLFINTLIILL